jgi:hypothetical protein
LPIAEEGNPFTSVGCVLYVIEDSTHLITLPSEDSFCALFGFLGGFAPDDDRTSRDIVNHNLTQGKMVSQFQ